MHKTLKWKWIQDYEKEKEQQKQTNGDDAQVGARRTA